MCLLKNPNAFQNYPSHNKSPGLNNVNCLTYSVKSEIVGNILKVLPFHPLNIMLLISHVIPVDCYELHLGPEILFVFSPPPHLQTIILENVFYQELK